MTQANNEAAALGHTLEVHLPTYCPGAAPTGSRRRQRSAGRPAPHPE